MSEDSSPPPRKGPKRAPDRPADPSGSGEDRLELGAGAGEPAPQARSRGRRRAASGAGDGHGDAASKAAPRPRSRRPSSPAPPPPPLVPSPAAVAAEPASRVELDAVSEHRPRFRGYVIEAEIGKGGMGVVYRAVAEDNGKKVVALKTINPAFLQNPEAHARFCNEIRFLKSLKSRNIVEMCEDGTSEREPFFTMEFLAGGSLSDRLARGEQPTPEEAALLVERLARTVDLAHLGGVVHRDLKPSNVLLRAHDSSVPLAQCTPVITDFGVAKLLESQHDLTVTGQVLGSPKYMAPEQARGDAKKVGPAADVYSLGAILYTLLTGRPPYERLAEIELGREPTPPRTLNADIPEPLEQVCLKCLRAEPEGRYASAEELAEALRHAQLEAATAVLRAKAETEASERAHLEATVGKLRHQLKLASAAPPAPVERFPRAAVAATFLGLVVIALLALSYFHSSLSRERDEAVRAAARAEEQRRAAVRAIAGADEARRDAERNLAQARARAKADLEDERGRREQAEQRYAEENQQRTRAQTALAVERVERERAQEAHSQERQRRERAEAAELEGWGDLDAAWNESSAQQLAAGSAQRERRRAEATLDLERGLRALERGETGPGLRWLRNARDTVGEDQELLRSVKTPSDSWAVRFPHRQMMARTDCGSVALSGDGSVLAVMGYYDPWRTTLRVRAGADGNPRVDREGWIGRRHAQLEFWEVATGTLRGVPVGPLKQVSEIALSRDGALCAFAVYSHEGHGFTDHRHYIFCLLQPGRAVHLELPRLYPLGPQTVVAWDNFLLEQDYPESRLYRDHMGKVIGSAISPGGRFIVRLGDTPEALELWAVKERKAIVPPLERARGETHCVEISHNDTLVAWGGVEWGGREGTERDGVLQIWEARTGRLVPGGSRSKTGPIYALAISASDRRIASIDASGLAVWQRQPSEWFSVALEFDQRNLQSVRFLDEDTVVTLDASGDINVHDLTEKRPVRSFSTRSGHTSNNRARLSADGKVVVSLAEGGDVQVWDVATGKPVETLSSPRKDVLSLVTSDDGRTVVKHDEDGTVTVWSRPLASDLTLPELLWASQLAYGAEIGPRGEVRDLSPAARAEMRRRLDEFRGPGAGAGRPTTPTR